MTDEGGGDDVGVGGGDAEEGTGRTERAAPAALPVAKRLAADADHVGELPTRLAESAPDLVDIDRFELASIPRARAESRASWGERAGEHQRIAHGIAAMVRPFSRRVEHVAGEETGVVDAGVESKADAGCATRHERGLGFSIPRASEPWNGPAALRLVR
jgi:hypothetical protein